ncbi:MAG: diguanylate cyclase [Mycobacteriales bacterium]|jgi:diguanylate cyclase (GGDEF)-like protein
MSAAAEQAHVLWPVTALLVFCGAAVDAATPESALGRGAYLGCFALIVITGWRAVRLAAPAARRPVRLIAGAMTSWLAGDLLDAGMRLTGIDSLPHLPDVLWLAGYPLIGGGLIGLVRRRAPGQGRAGALDGLILTTAAALGAWQVLVAPAVRAQELTAGVIIGALYPLGDIILLASVLFLVLSPGRRGTPTRLLVTGMALTLVCDLVLALPQDVLRPGDGARLDGVLLLANGLVVASIRHSRRAELLTPVWEPVAKLHRARLPFLGVALLAAPLVAITRNGQPVSVQLPLLVGIAVTVGFSLARFTGAVHEQVRAQQLLAHLAAHDELTGLANRRTLVGTLEREFRPGSDTVLLYLDLNLFKGINDQHGHAAGDAVLIEVGRRLQAGVRPGDLVARLGGDEFAVLCHRIDGVGARRLADRLATSVYQPIRWGEQTFAVATSVGQAGAQACRTADDLIGAADEAMLAAKRRWHDSHQASGSPVPSGRLRSG